MGGGLRHDHLDVSEDGVHASYEACGRTGELAVRPWLWRAAFRFVPAWVVAEVAAFGATAGGVHALSHGDRLRRP